MRNIDPSQVVRYCQALARQQGQDFFKMDWQQQAQIRKTAIAAVRRGDSLDTARQALARAGCPQCGYAFTEKDMFELMQAKRVSDELAPVAEPLLDAGREPSDGNEDAEDFPKPPKAPQNRGLPALPTLGKSPFFKKRSAFLIGGGAYEKTLEGSK